jgi:hypothetical protein
MPETFNFTGDATTFIGLVGVVSTAIIIFTAFRRFYSSPYNISVKSRKFVDSNSTNENAVQN